MPATEKENFALAADRCHNGYSGQRGERRGREVEQMRRERDVALAVVEAAQQHTCLWRTDGTNFRCLLCSALAVTTRLADKGEK